jgi:DNA replication protein DnaC
LEEFTFDHQPGLKRDTIAHLGTGVFLTEAKNVVLLGPPGTGKTHLAIGLGVKATHASHRVLLRRQPNGLPDARPRTAPTGSQQNSNGYADTG